MAHMIIGTRGSLLARQQGQWVKSRIERIDPWLVVGQEVIAAGDDDDYFVAVEAALLERRIDCALFDLNELPAGWHEELHLAAITEREEANEVLVVSPSLRRRVNQLRDLPAGAQVGVNQLRRAAQLRVLRPDLRLLAAPASIEERLHALDDGAFDALIAAHSSLTHLAAADRVAVRFDPAQLLPVAGQGALCLVSRVFDQRTNLLLETINHWPTRYAVEAERTLTLRLGCRPDAPLAAFGRLECEQGKQQLVLAAMVADVRERRVMRRELFGSLPQGELLGAELAQKLTAEGARDLLDAAAAFTPTDIEELYPVAGVAVDADELSLAPAELPIAYEAAPRKFSFAAAVRSFPIFDFSSVHGAAELAAVVPRALKPAVPHALPLPLPSPVSAELQELPLELLAEPLAQPLADKRIVLAQTIEDEELTTALLRLGAEVIVCPPVDIQEPESWATLDRALIHLSWYDWLTFPNSAAVEFFLQRLDELGHRRAEIASHRLCAVGEKAAAILNSEGLGADVMLEQFTAASFAEACTRRFGIHERLSGAQMLMPAAPEAQWLFRAALDRLDVYLEVVAAYRTVGSAAGTVEQMCRAPFDYVILSDAPSVDHLAALLVTDRLAAQLGGARVVCVGATTAEVARAHGCEVQVQYNGNWTEEMIEVLLADLSQTAR